MIGTGSSGIQSIPHIAEQADKLFVFQRSANYSVPAGNAPLDDATRAEQKANYAERRRLSWESGGGSPHRAHPKLTLEATEEERRAAYEERWKLGGVLYSKTFPDQLTDQAANDAAREFWEEKVRAVIDDPAIADLLIPDDHAIGAKRIVTDSGYYETYNRDNVELVNLKATPIVGMDAAGVNTTEAHYDLDAIVLATGFDAMTGSLDKLDIVGRGGQSLKEKWAAGPEPTSVSASTASPTSSTSPGPVARRCWRTWCCTPNSTSTGSPTRSPTSTTAVPRRSRAPRRPWPTGSRNAAPAPRHRC